MDLDHGSVVELIFFELIELNAVNHQCLGKIGSLDQWFLIGSYSTRLRTCRVNGISLPLISLTWLVWLTVV
jgi:hypothetical protein